MYGNGYGHGSIGAGDIDIVGALQTIIGALSPAIGAGDIDIVGYHPRYRMGAGDEADLIHSILSGDDEAMLGAAAAAVRAGAHGMHPAVHSALRAGVHPAHAKQMALAHAMHQLRGIDPNAKLLRHADKFLHRRQTIGATTSVDVPAGGDFQITIQPQRPFKTTRWIVSSDVAFFFNVTDVKVGQVSQFAASSVTPASAFTEQARDADVDWDTADIGNLIVITGTNIDTLGHPFRSNLFGTSLVPQF